MEYPFPIATAHPHPHLLLRQGEDPTLTSGSHDRISCSRDVSGFASPDEQNWRHAGVKPRGTSPVIWLGTEVPCAGSLSPWPHCISRPCVTLAWPSVRLPLITCVCAFVWHREYYTWVRASHLATHFLSWLWRKAKFPFSPGWGVRGSGGEHTEGGYEAGTFTCIAFDCP